MASFRTLSGALACCIMLAGCNDSNKTAGTDDGSGTFVSCAGTLVDGKCLIAPAVVIDTCEQGSLIDGKCIVTPVAITVCQTGTLVDGQCIVTPAVTAVCQTGTLEGDKCVVKPSITTGACEKGTLVGTECVIKPEATFVCGAGILEVDKCVVKPSITTGACEKGTLVGTECVIKPEATFVCGAGILEVDKCVVKPSITTGACEKGTLVGTECVVKPEATFVCGAGALEVDKCVIRPVATTRCDKGTLEDDVCVIKPVVVSRCARGTLVDGECVEVKVPSVTDPVNRDDGIRRVDWNGSSAAIETADLVSTLRTYKLTTTQDQRKANKGKQLKIEERANDPTIRTGSQMFDGLFAMAMQEARELTVTSIKDGAYNNGNSVPCGGTIGCYQSGDEWTYVWTRDTAYAVDLGLAQINPQAAKNSLLFKLSKRRNATQTLGAETTEIVQDTGSGGSWPVSTDRVVWARAAFELLKYLDGEDRTQFLNDAYTAIRNTIESDRLAAYDNRDGLYRGETSFLDWREQTYPDWMKDTVVHIAMSKTLSTNINHWKILDVAAKMAVELNKAPDAAKFADWADDLKQRIRNDLWLKDAGMFSMMKITELDQAPVRRFELLGEALAIQDGIADKGQTTSILENYPHTTAGAAVVWPQVQDLKVYHNRAIWPFVSSYLIKAAKGRNADVVNRNFDTLINGAALNLSNMENFEFTKLAVTAPRDEDRPEIDSDKQLWSVGGYIGSVLDVVFGREANMKGIRFEPFITKKMHKDVFNGARQIQLNNLEYRGRKITVKVNLPDAGLSAKGSYKAQTVMLNGSTIPLDRYTPASDLNIAGTNILVVELIDNPADGGVAKVVGATNPHLYGPRTVDFNRVENNNGSIKLDWKDAPPLWTGVNIYRNGVSIATGIPGREWTDTPGPGEMGQALCYSLERQYTREAYDNVSQRTNPSCYWSDRRIETIGANSATNKPVADAKTGPITEHGRRSWSNWGLPEEELTFKFIPSVDGTYHILLNYGNAFGPVNTGVTAAVKKMDVAGAGKTLNSGIVVMPHLDSWDTWGESTVVPVKLEAGTEYTIKLSDFYNMSYLASNATYNDRGGKEGILNRANITELILRRMAD
ncbi:hypothetical protein [Phyllobacterium bourgognense]|uniref:Alpha-L-rhamnosidase six-hairpin glycosidase domain-containing protein n=1 Tax=Phyllobacterium bourgognense TaxID=314236 RepID=A0A368YY26_9HYPH|nr:hypothetical protein [Phyllobacterium bourgognense]RCW84539.1 hypothetical protein C7476_104295 [Phyllobacterium bourgognense]